MIYLTSDFHFGHSNIIHFCHRPFFDLQDMEDELIKRYNDVIRPKDDVYILGDITHRIPATRANDLIRQLKGKKHLIRGNHDSEYDASLFEEIVYYKELRYKKMLFTLCHYPFEAWRKMEHGGYMLHGHLHSDGYRNILATARGIRKYDVGVDANDYAPVSLDHIIELYNK